MKPRTVYVQPGEVSEQRRLWRLFALAFVAGNAIGFALAWLWL